MMEGVVKGVGNQLLQNQCSYVLVNKWYAILQTYDQISRDFTIGNEWHGL